MHTYICVYIYIERERDRYTHAGRRGLEGVGRAMLYYNMI